MSPRSVYISWESSALAVDGYLILYTTTAAYARNGSMTVSRGSIATLLTNLEENTFYIITVQIFSNVTDFTCDALMVTTWSDGKLWYL